ncbi:hypothetical protein ABNQ39_26655 [Azospirillum sp. A26]|uniref:hypothetical protein n=1 Tax=Azospirillum sp. A26 TaxID=3160607 RepID=UPI00366A846A
MRAPRTKSCPSSSTTQPSIRPHYVRNDAGLLIDQIILARTERVGNIVLMDLLAAAARLYAKAGFPFTVSDTGGFHANRENMYPELRLVGRNRLEELTANWIRKCRKGCL